MEALLEVEARRVQILEERPEAARRAVTALFFVNGMLLATWVSRIPAIERLRGLNHATFGLALLIVAHGIRYNNGLFRFLGWPAIHRIYRRTAWLALCSWNHRCNELIDRDARSSPGGRLAVG
jgi:hypothetical protein